MTKTKRQLRAEAVERLKNHDPKMTFISDMLGDELRAILTSQGLSNLDVRNALIDLLTDDELPEGDVLDKNTVREIIERNFNRVAIVDDGTGKPIEWRDDLVCSVGFDFSAITDEIADMIERDYVPRWRFDELADAYEKMADLSANQAAELNAMTAERDEWKAKAEQSERAMNEAAGKWAKADADNCELRKMLLLDDGTVEDYTERADPLTALAHQKQLAEEWRERCHAAEAECAEWKAKADKLAERMDKREDTMRRLAKLVDVTPEAEYSYNGDPQSVVDGGDFGELATLVFGAVRRLMSERDEWKAKAEGSSKVRAGSSNLEWLYEHDMELAGYEHQHDERLKAFEIAYRTQLDRLTEQNNQQARIIENLAAALARSTE